MSIGVRKSTRAHIICGMCGADSTFITYEINPRGRCNYDAEEVPG